jgi:glutamyl-Q tRNA(Asp) synthetase
MGVSAAPYRGRFAPSPTGPLHAGSLVAALASWLDARAHQGLWLVRIEDVDTTRCIPAMAPHILAQLAACGLHADEPPVWQAQRTGLYAQALEQLVDSQRAYPCACSRKDIDAVWQNKGLARARHQELIYPGTCRAGLAGRPARAWRFLANRFMPNQALNHAFIDGNATNSIANSVVHWTDRRLGPQQQDVAADVGDFILKRADGCFSYQLAVVVDDAAQGITHVVRGEDLADNTARQILLQNALALPNPRYLHTPLVRGDNGEKLSKQNGAQALDTTDPLQALNSAARVLGLPVRQSSVPEALTGWVADWARLYNPTP